MICGLYFSILEEEGGGQQIAITIMTSSVSVSLQYQVFNIFVQFLTDIKVLCTRRKKRLVANTESSVQGLSGLRVGPPRPGQARPRGYGLGYVSLFKLGNINIIFHFITSRSLMYVVQANKSCAAPAARQSEAVRY